VDKTTSKQRKVQQFESSGFQDRQAVTAAETSGNYYYNSGRKLEWREGKGSCRKEKKITFKILYILSFLAGKFLQPRACYLIARILNKWFCVRHHRPLQAGEAVLFL